jgi:ankyrin repeat protein
MTNQEIDFKQEIDRLIHVRTHVHVGALLDELKKLDTWPSAQLSELLQQLCWLGGNRWPTALCAMGADPNYVDDEGQTALSICLHAAGGEFMPEKYRAPPVDTFETACELLQVGANPNSTYLSMFSVTHLALSGNLPQFVCLFLVAGADLNLEEPDSLSERTLRQELMTSSRQWGRKLVSIFEKSRS